MFKLDKPINGEDAAYAKVYAAKLLPLIKHTLEAKCLILTSRIEGLYIWLLIQKV